MKNILIINITIFIAIFFTACGSKQISYDKYNIERNLNPYISKIENYEINIIDESPSWISKKLGNKSYSLVTYELEAKKINLEVAKEFFRQYFNNVNRNIIENRLVVKTRINDFTIDNTLNPNNQKVSLVLEVKVFRSNELILNKTYSEIAPGYSIWEWRLTPEEITYRKLQKGVLYIYETKFKPDLLKALEKNKYKYEGTK